MKKILFVENQERENILTQHEEQKPINLLEQSAKVIEDARKLFKRAQSQGCLTDPGLDYNNLKFKKSQPNKIYIISVGKTSGKVKRVYNDFTFEILDPSGKVLKSGTWSCEEKTEPVQTPQQKKEQDIKKYLDQWVVYYSGQPSYKGLQIKHQLDVTPVEKATWKQISIPDSAKDTGSEKFIYVSSEKQQVDGEKPKEDKTLKDVRVSTDIPKDECEKIIEQWYQNFATKPDDFDKAYFDKEKPRAMYCKRRFYKKWGVDFNASRLNKIIEFMSRTRDSFEGRISPSLRSPWKLD
jgi:hypothetical protein